MSGRRARENKKTREKEREREGLLAVNHGRCEAVDNIYRQTLQFNLVFVKKLVP